jgi:hypothetical protein
MQGRQGTRGGPEPKREEINLAHRDVDSGMDREAERTHPHAGGIGSHSVGGWVALSLKERGRGSPFNDITGQLSSCCRKCPFHTLYASTLLTQLFSGNHAKPIIKTTRGTDSPQGS